MLFFDYLFEQFGVNEPIMSNEITFGNYSKPWIYKQLNTLVTEGKLIRFEKVFITFQQILYLEKVC